MKNYDFILTGRIKPVFKCKEEFKTKFNESTCLLTISVGQEVHEGEKFLTTIQLVNDHFRECTILVDDSLQRHTMMLDCNEVDENLIYERSINEGDLWLERNKVIYEQLQIPYKIIRWDKWLKHNEYKKINSIIEEKYERDDEYRKAFNDSINEFLRRYENRLDDSGFDRQKAFELCLTYLKEECTALCLWVEGDFHFEVYPNKRNLAMTATHEIFVKPHHPHLLHPVAIKFKNRKQLKPQKFTA